MLLICGACSVFLSDEARAAKKGPEQPILFSHKIHAGDNKIECRTCHSYVAVSTHPGIPSVQKCMGCHTHIQGRDEEYKADDGSVINLREEIAKLKEYWEKKEPIPWIKVSPMAEYVQFSHKRHIKKGIECKTCHGEVEKMDVVRKVERLNMGFCISCHEENAENEYHETQLKDCLTCHY
ncbi:MAG: cytochrome c3 family protein [Thermodesulfobacteriota bacterium]